VNYWCVFYSAEAQLDVFLTVLKTRLEVQLFEEEFGRFKKIVEFI